jgi:hypothetical protein
VDITATMYTAEGLVDALCRHVEAKGPGRG